MPKVRDILKHVSVEVAARSRRCRRDEKVSIPKGDRCLVIKTGATNDPYSYSQHHAKEILDSACVKLKKFYVELDLSPPNWPD